MANTHPSLYVIVDDDEDDRLLARLALKHVHWQLPILEFADGQELLDYLAGLSIDQLQAASQWLIVLDINMPRLNGFDTIQALRTHPVWSTLPIIVLSTSQDEEAQQKALDRGANAYAVKPTSVEALTQVFNTHFAPWLMD